MKNKPLLANFLARPCLQPVIISEMLIFEIVLTISRGLQISSSSIFGLAVFSLSLANLLYDDTCQEYLSREVINNIK